jgi:transposase InsO family protein
MTAQQPITEQRLGSAYHSTVHAIACRTLAIRHLRTRPYRPHTNGKAERFASSARCSAAGHTARSTATAANATPHFSGWLDFCNRQRPHDAIDHKPPIARLHEPNNLLGSYYY